jgi:hypothetical protein
MVLEEISAHLWMSCDGEEQSAVSRDYDASFGLW